MWGSHKQLTWQMWDHEPEVNFSSAQTGGSPQFETWIFRPLVNEKIYILVKKLKGANLNFSYTQRDVLQNNLS